MSIKIESNQEFENGFIKELTEAMRSVIEKYQDEKSGKIVSILFAAHESETGTGVSGAFGNLLVTTNMMLDNEDFQKSANFLISQLTTPKN